MHSKEEVGLFLLAREEGMCVADAASATQDMASATRTGVGSLAELPAPRPSVTPTRCFADGPQPPHLSRSPTPPR